MTTLPAKTDFYIDWSPYGEWSYHEFLKAKQLESIQLGIAGQTEAIRLEMESQTKQLIGSNEQFLKRGFGTIHSDLSTGFSALSRDVAAVRGAIDASTGEISSALRWGFSRLATRIGQMNDTLNQIEQELRRIGNALVTPSQTWAYERYLIARDEFNRGLYPEALESVTWAIHGHGSNTGFKSEFRFHFLLGAIHIGSWIGKNPNVSKEIVNPALAEDAFLNAARYFNGEKADPKAEALFRAGRAAFLQGSISRAIDHTRAGMDLLGPGVPGLRAAGHYQLARQLCVQGDQFEDATFNLRCAVDLDLSLLIEAGAELEILNRGSVFETVFSAKTQQLREEYQRLSRAFAEGVLRWKAFKFEGIWGATALAEDLARLDRIAASASEEAANGGPLDFDSANATLKRARPSFDPLTPKFVKHLTDHWRVETARGRQEHFRPAQEARAEAIRLDSEVGEVRKECAARQRELLEQKNNQAWKLVSGFLLSLMALAVALAGVENRVIESASVVGDNPFAFSPSLLAEFLPGFVLGAIALVLFASRKRGDRTQLESTEAKLVIAIRAAALAREGANWSEISAGETWRPIQARLHERSNVRPADLPRLPDYSGF